MNDDIDSFEASLLEQFLGENWAAFVALLADCGRREAVADALMKKLRAKVEG